MEEATPQSSLDWILLDYGITKLSNADLLNFAFGSGQDVVFDCSSVPKLKRFVIGANERQLHYVFTRLSKHVPRMRSLTVKTRLYAYQKESPSSKILRS
ncbi:hypothetical protein NC652_039000 [Populus alba x Populus x berolinensis]|nr:hypothetical protein NC652_039000 [Populus alba x Populus x berolinensis]